MHDLVIIGAGPAGCRLASLCAPFADVLVLEEHRAPGGKACSGLVSPRFLELVPRRVSECPGLVEHELRAARVHLGGETISISKRGTAAYAIDRGVLDRELAALAAEAGCAIRYGERAAGLAAGKDSARVATGDGTYDCRLAAGCDGAGSVAARGIGPASREMLNGLVLTEDREDHGDCVDMWPDQAAGGFLWKIPRGERTEYGGMGKGLGFAAVERFFGLGKRRLSRSAAPIPIGAARTFSERLLLVGDAACQTKPWSGGGLTYGLLAAQSAAVVIKKCLKNDDLSAAALSEYERLWKGVLFRDMQAGMLAREMLKDHGGLLPGLVKVLSQRGGTWEKIDFDFPFTGLLGALRPKDLGP